MIYLNKRKWMDFNMCTTLRRINGLTPEEILNTYGDKSRNSYPIDISKILYEMEIRVHPFDFSALNKREGKKILGALVADNENLALLYEATESINRNRFTLAHELAHCCLMHLDDEKIPYIEYRCEGEVADKKEIDANIFAGKILIPEKELCGVLISKFPDEIPNAKDLAQLFVVSVNVMKERLKWLNIPFIDEYGRKIFCME